MFAKLEDVPEIVIAENESGEFSAVWRSSRDYSRESGYRPHGISWKEQTEADVCKTCRYLQGTEREGRRPTAESIAISANFRGEVRVFMQIPKAPSKEFFDWLHSFAFDI